MRSLWNGQIVDDTKQYYFDEWQESVDKVYDLQEELSELDKMFIDTGRFDEALYNDCESDLKKALKECEDARAEYLACYKEDLGETKSGHPMPKSYRWMKWYIKHNKYNTYFDYVVYKAIKSNMNTEHFLEYIKKSWDAVYKKRQNNSLYCSFITELKWFKNVFTVDDSCWSVTDGQYYDYENKKWIPCAAYKSKLSGMSYAERKKFEFFREVNNSSLYLVDNLIKTPGITFYKKISRDSDYHPIEIHLSHWVPGNDYKMYCTCCMILWHLIKSLDYVTVTTNIDDSKYCSNLAKGWIPKEEREKLAKKKAQDDKIKSLPKPVRKIVNYIKNYHLENVIKEVL